MTEKTYTRRWRRLISLLLRARANPAPPLAGEFQPTRCFGALRDSEQLALENFVTARQHAVQAPPSEAPDPGPAP